ncbi:hypothetical protein [Parendozoicomonas haliclonae]|nr:hypothetical protein [Parendozoicomonas haliclonae]
MSTGQDLDETHHTLKAFKMFAAVIRKLESQVFRDYSYVNKDMLKKPEHKRDYLLHCLAKNFDSHEVIRFVFATCAVWEANPRILHHNHRVPDVYDRCLASEINWQRSFPFVGRSIYQKRRCVSARGMQAVGKWFSDQIKPIVHRLQDELDKETQKAVERLERSKEQQLWRVPLMNTHRKAKQTQRFREAKPYLSRDTFYKPIMVFPDGHIEPFNEEAHRKYMELEVT